MKRLIPSITAFVLGMPTIWLLDVYITFDNFPDWLPGAIGIGVGMIYLVLGFFY